MSNPRQLTIHQSLTAPELIAGCERHLLWPFATIIACILFAGLFSLWGWLVVIVVGGFGYWGLVSLAKIDPLWSRVYWRSLQYQSYYPAHTRTAIRLKRIQG